MPSGIHLYSSLTDSEWCLLPTALYVVRLQVPYRNYLLNYIWFNWFFVIYIYILLFHGIVFAEYYWQKRTFKYLSSEINMSEDIHRWLSDKNKLRLRNTYASQSSNFKEADWLGKKIALKFTWFINHKILLFFLSNG